MSNHLGMQRRSTKKSSYNGFKANLQLRAVSRALSTWRDERGLSLREASDAAGWSTAKTSTMQNAAVSVSECDVVTLALIYGVANELRAPVFHGAQRARNPRAYDRLPDAPPCIGWTYGDLATEASTLHIVAIDALPHVIRTFEYTSALLSYHTVTTNTRNNTSLSKENHLQIRKNLYEEASLDLHIVMSDAILRRSCCSTPAMADQLMRIVQLTQLPNVLIQIVADHAGELESVTSSFSIMGYREDRFDDVAYLENQHGSIWIEDKATLQPYLQTFKKIASVAFTEDASTDLITEALQEHKS
ncbi:helix-turn-helix transcriptional regulator [Lentzea sp. NPDC042327]|uniref:helix-turn-helix domain-containing protein n=1 Tax=Lentzea sp. NPDC042327 TaxID=3154801 RepID=UPI00340326B1